MPSPQALALQQQMAAAPKDLVLTLAEQRAMCEMFGQLAAEPSPVTYSPDTVAGLPCEWARPGSPRPGAVVVYVHGGGFLMGSVSMYRRLVGHLALAAGAAVLSVDYRLAPEHVFPAALDDVDAVLDEVVGPETDVALVGDSAGGALVLGTVLRRLQEGRPIPAAVATLSAWADLTCNGDSYRTRATQDAFANPEAGRALAAQYLGGASPEDPIASPVFGDYGGFPPLLLQVGDHEALLDDSTRICAAARRAGVEATLRVWPEMHHVFQLAAGTIPEADLAVAELGTWLAGQLVRPPA